MYLWSAFQIEAVRKMVEEVKMELQVSDAWALD